MSAWPGKYVIGLTGNIATGKSVVRKMLEHLGAYGIDADALAHRSMAKGAPGYQSVIETFGKWVVGPDGQIDRTRLGRIVFSDPEALARLESILHPLVGQAVDILVRRSPQKVIVVEAIKLIEAGLAAKCDSLWTTYAAPHIQLARLMQKRGMTEAVARQRIAAQLPQEQKVTAANVVIRNESSFEDTWRQVSAAWLTIFPAVEPEPEPVKTRDGKLEIERARPRQTDDIARLINRLSGGRKKLTRDDVMAAFGEKAFLILKKEGRPMGIAGWKVENLVARTDDVYIESGAENNNVTFVEAMGALLSEVERASRELQCEISLLFLPPDLARQDRAFQKLGYQTRTIQSLGVRAWQEAAVESMPAGSVLFFKQLRQDRVLKPV